MKATTITPGEADEIVPELGINTLQTALGAKDETSTRANNSDNPTAHLPLFKNRLPMPTAAPSSRPHRPKTPVATVVIVKE